LDGRVSIECCIAPCSVPVAMNEKDI
jgi:hypothetical protein